MSKDQVKAEQNLGVPRVETKPSPELSAAPSFTLASCERCGRVRNLVNTGTFEHPFLECGTCIHRRERSINTREMWGKGRRGY